MLFRSILAIAVPFAGTTLGAALVFFLKGEMNAALGRAMNGFAAGVMVAASVWSLILPAIERAMQTGVPAFLPPLAGVWVGFLFLLVLDRLIPRLTVGSLSHDLGMMTLAVTLHNLPEGMAVGVAVAGYLSGDGIPAAGVLALSLGIALQNIPEGAIISLPLRSGGMGRGRSFTYGFLSGVIEPIGGVMTILLAAWMIPILPYMLSFAAGAMLYVVVVELIPETYQEGRSDLGTIFFAVGFTLMMVLDVALG